MSAGAMTWLRDRGPSGAAAAGVSMGIGSYDVVLLASPGFKPPGGSDWPRIVVMPKQSALGLTGLKNVESRSGRTGFVDDVDLSGPGRLVPGGIASHEVPDEPASYGPLVEFLETLAASGRLDEAPTPPQGVVIPTAPLVITRSSWTEPEDVELLIRRGQEEAKAFARRHAPFEVAPFRPYDTKFLFDGFFDRDSIRRVRQERSYHSMTGFATLHGLPIAFWGVQQLTEMEERNGTKIPVRVGASLFPDSSRHAAEFIEGLRGQRIPLVTVPAILGFSPLDVGEDHTGHPGQKVKGGNLMWGSALERALQHHDAPVIQMLGPDQALLGGGYVVVSPWISDWGHVEMYADPRALVAVLDPTMWKYPGFGKRAMADMRARVAANKISDPAGAETIAERWLVGCISALSHPLRAKRDQSITDVVPVKEFRGLAAGRVSDWYNGRWQPVHHVE